MQVWSSGGMDHLEAKHRLAEQVAARAERGRHTVVLHIGDHDKAGRTIFRVLEEDVRAMAEDIVLNAGDWVAFVRLWITEKQAWTLHRAGKSQGLDGDGLPEVQAEAIPIADRPAIIRGAIEAVHRPAAVRARPGPRPRRAQADRSEDSSMSAKPDAYLRKSSVRDLDREESRGSPGGRRPRARGPPRRRRRSHPAGGLG